MRQIRIIHLMVAFLLMAGCATMSGVSESEKALTLTSQYNSLEQTYKNQYRAAGPDERKWLKENIAPELDRARNLLIEYNELVQNEEPTQDQQIRILGLLRQASMQLLEVRDEE